MSNTTVIQVRVPKAIKLQSERRAAELGLASVQEAIRVFLASFAKGWARPGIFTKEEEEEYVKLAPRAKKRYAKILDDLKHGRNVYKFDNPQDALTWLNQQ